MKKVRVNKTKLLQTLIDNRDVHICEYGEVYEGYRQQKIKQLVVALERAEAKKEFSLNFEGSEPICYISHFDTAIEMVEWSEEQIIELDKEDFKRYVLNDWEWADRFKMHQTMYLGKKRA